MPRKTIILTSLGVISLLISFLFSLGLVVGYFIGNYFSKRILEEKTKLKPLIFHIKSWRVHLHHWFLSAIAIVSVLISGYFAQFPDIFYGILGGLIFQDIYFGKKWYKKHFYWEEKWYKVLSRKVN